MTEQNDAAKKKSAEDLARDGSPQARLVLGTIVGVIILVSLVYTISGFLGYRGKVPFSSTGSGDSQMAGHAQPAAAGSPSKLSPTPAPAPAPAQAPAQLPAPAPAQVPATGASPAVPPATPPATVPAAPEAPPAPSPGK